MDCHIDHKFIVAKQRKKFNELESRPPKYHKMFGAGRVQFTGYMDTDKFI